ncbi:hypothetical protein [Halovenus salina]|uniref:Uncharacterized protein n=1 Tax=Halovenus salina TaxID=1510225 RepID=A0ABD5W0H2_9EURY|nr:hypothetical protein [Halovenus salina]
MEVVVDATDACGERARILNLPSEASRFGFDGFADENLAAGDDSIISKGTSGSTWEVGVLHVENKNTFEAGESFEFRIASTECGLNDGDKIDVDLVHTTTNSVMVTQELRVRN